MKNYKITRQGKIVLYVLLIVLVSLCFGIKVIIDKSSIRSNKKLNLVNKYNDTKVIKSKKNSNLNNKSDADVYKIKKMLINKKNETSSLGDKLSDKKSETDKLDDELKVKLKQQEGLDKILTSKKNEVDAIGNNLVKRKSEVDNIEKILAQRKAEKDQIEKQLASKKAEVDLEQKNLMNKKLQSSSIDDDMAIKESTNNSIEKSIETKKAEAAELQTILNAKKTAVAALQGDYISRQNDIKRLQANYSDKKGQVDELQKQVIAKNDVLSKLEQNIKQKAVQSQKINEELKNTQEELNNLIVEINAAKLEKTKIQTKESASISAISAISSASKKRVDIFYSPHPDDEVLSMGMAIAQCIKNGDEVHVVLMTHGYDSNAINIINGLQVCRWHNKKHNPIKEGYKKLTKQIMGNLRVKEFIKSVHDLGVSAANIHICNFDEDGVSSYEMKLVMLGFENQYPGAYHYTTSYYDAHPFHKKLGQTLLDLYKAKQVKNAQFFISPVQWSKVSGNYIKDSSLNSIVTKSLSDYMSWNTKKNEFAIGYHSYPQPFEIVRKQLASKFHIPGKVDISVINK